METVISLGISCPKALPPGLMDWLDGWLDGYLSGLGIEGSAEICHANKAGNCAPRPAGPEVWRRHPTLGAYEVSDHGRVRSIDRVLARGRTQYTMRGRILRQSGLPSGHQIVHIYDGGGRSNRYVHRLVLETFVGMAPVDKPYALHGNGIPQDNRLENLRWGNQVENAEDKKLHGTYQFGETASRSRLTQAQVLAILSDSRSGAQIAKDYGIRGSQVNKIKAGRSWKHLSQGKDDGQPA